MRLRISFGLILLAFLLMPEIAVASASETTDPELDAAIALYRSEGPETAYPVFGALLETYQSRDDRINESIALRYNGEIHWRLGELDESRSFLNRSLAMSRNTGQRYGEGKALNVLGLLEWDLGNLQEALTSMMKAHAIAIEIDDKRLTASTLNNMGLVHDELGDYETSLAEYQRSLDLFKEVNDLRGQGDALGNTGGVHLLLGHFSEALGYYKRALAISEELSLKPAMTIDHGNIALCYLGMGRFDTALNHFDQAMALAVDTGMLHEQAYWQRSKANLLIRQGKLDLGLENHRKALSVYEETGARGLLLDGYHDMGRLHLKLGDLESADNYFRRAISQAREIGHQQAVTANLAALGELHFASEQVAEAQALYLQVLQRATEAGEVNYQTEALLRLAELDLSLQNHESATAYAMRALDQAMKYGASTSVAEAWLALAEAHRGSGENPRAYEAYAAAETASGKNGDPELQWRVHYGRALTLVADGQKSKAVDELLLAAGIIENVRDRLKEDRFRAGYLQDKYQVYTELVQLQFELSRYQDAFSTAERLRFRIFLTQLDQAGSIARSPDDRLAETQLREKIRQLQELLAEEQGKPINDRRQLAANSFSKELLRAEREYQAFLDDLTTHTPSIRFKDLPDLDDIQGQLGAQEALIEYVVSDDNILVFVVRSDRVAVESMDLKRASLEARIELVRAMIQQPGNQRWQKPAARLSELIVTPALSTGLLADAKHIYIVPHGMLNYLPFAVLPVSAPENKMLVEAFTLSYLPAAVALIRPAAVNLNSGSVLALAPKSANLRYAAEEARSISALFSPDSRFLEGSEATETAFRSRAADFAVLHLATHGFFNRRNPMLSGLKLEADKANDGLLEVHEIMELRLNAELVTLSACETALGSGWFSDVPAGDDFVGLTRAFLFAGSGSVLATLWEVDDESTIELMKGFYQNISEQLTSKDQATALALVQRKLRSSEKFSHPFYWAPFVLVGPQANTAAQI